MVEQLVVAPDHRSWRPNPPINGHDLLLLFSCSLPLFGILLDPAHALVAALMVAAILALSRQPASKGGTALTWGVMVEPAPCDILFAFAWLRRLGRRRLSWYKSFSTSALLAFVILNFVQFFLARELARGLWYAGVTTYVISLCFLLTGVIRTSTGFRSIERWYLASTIVAALTLLILTTLFLAGAASHGPTLYYASRPKGFFKDPNVAAPFVVTGALAALSWLIFSPRKAILKPILMLAITVAAVVVTFSRGALVNLFVGIVIIGCFALLRGRGSRFASIVIIALLLLAPLMPKLLTRFGQAQRFEGLMPYDLYGRQAAFRASLQIFADHPLGIGPGQFEIVSPTYQEKLAVANSIITPSAHNTYLRALAENGLLGLALLLAGSLSIWWASLKTALRAKGLEAVTAATWLCGAWGGLLVEGCFIDTLHWRHLWIIAGLILAHCKLQAQAQKAQPIPHAEATSG